MGSGGIAVASAVSLVLVLATPTAGAPGAKLDLSRLRVLVCVGYFDTPNIPAVRRLKAAGAQVREGTLNALTWDVAKQYHLIIVCAQSPKPGPAGERAVQALAKFVKSGGGLMFFRLYYGSEKADAYLKPMGASMPWELVQDPAHTYRSPTGFHLTYAYTDRVTPAHPVTQGVKAVWYSAGKTHLFHTSPLVVSKDWQVLVSASSQARTIWVGGLHEEHLTKPGTFRSAPPIIAARAYGRGAVVLVGISPMEVFYGQGLPAYQNVAMAKGDGLRPSGMGRLYENALRWLADHARKATSLGQGTLKPVVNPWAKPALHDWTKDVFGGDLCTQPARGVIGVHSTLSDGRATPQAMIAKAKSLGLAWLAFTERLESFSPAKWKTLGEVCRSASTPTFAALPGLDYQDAAGARYVVFGHFDWPPAKVFSKDKKRIVEPTWWFNIKMAPNGPYDPGHSPLRPWDFSMYDFWAVRTTIAGKRVDQAVDAYRYLHGIHDDPFPMAVDMVRDEAELAAASRRMCNFITQNQPGDLTKFYRDLAYYGSYRGFVSDGPIVTDWRAVNNTRISGGKWWLPGTERYRVKLAVRSDALVTDVRIYDGPTLFRRFRPNQKKVTLTFDLPHDQQRNLVADITDAAGKRAVTGGLFIRDFLNWRFMCTDRGNSICDAIQVDEAGAYLTGPTAPYQRKMTAFGLCAGYGERHFNMLPPMFDGGMRPVGMQVTPWFRASGYTFTPHGPRTLETRMHVPVCSRDGLLQGDTVMGYFVGKTNAWHRKSAPKNIEGVRVGYRYLDITPRAHDPGVILLEGTMRFERAMKLESVHLFAVFHSSQPGEGDHYAIVTPQANVAGMAAGKPFHASGRAVPGSFACVFPSLWGSTGIMALDDGTMFNVSAKPSNVHIGATLANMPRQMKAGDVLRYRYVLMHGRAGERPNTADWERFAKTMGFRGRPAYQVKDVRCGRVKGTTFLLELEASDGGFAGTVTGADLPIRLPVRVADMNPNWTFAWFDLDRHQWFPSAVDAAIGQGYFTLDTRRGVHRLFAGHPVLADNPDVRIAVLSDGKRTVDAVLNNVGDQPMQVRVRLHPALGKAAPQSVTIAPGALHSVRFTIGVAPPR